jgi:hypothetical protein
MGNNAWPWIVNFGLVMASQIGVTAPSYVRYVRDLQ